MRNTIAITSLFLALAAPAAATAAPPAKLSRADASASARSTAADVERRFEQYGYHAVTATLGPVQRVGPRQFRTVVGLIATAVRPGGRDGSCLFAIYTWQTRDHTVLSRFTSPGCTPLFER
jgi:hypothetical protein